MVNRSEVALIYSYDENWIGGAYYIQNLILALNRLQDEKKPFLKIVCKTESEFEQLKTITQYPYLKKVDPYLKIHPLLHLINKISYKYFRKKIFKDFYNDFDIIFPVQGELNVKSKGVILYWIPDFQEHHLPEFFSQQEVKDRRDAQQAVICKGTYIVFSSYDAKNDFNTFYPHNNLKQFVLNFAVTHLTDQQSVSLSDLKQKYQLPEKYFLCSNQFWRHKNQTVVIEAVHNLKKLGISIAIVFTGKEYDSRAPEYFNQLNELVTKYNVREHIFFLGFLPRSEQLILMKNAEAIIQPSLFEGWSTVIEDAKSLNAKIIGSSINVHKEQLLNYDSKIFFEPNDSLSLAAALQKKIPASHFNYDILIEKYAEDFTRIIQTIATANT